MIVLPRIAARDNLARRQHRIRVRPAPIDQMVIGRSPAFAPPDRRDPGDRPAWRPARDHGRRIAAII
jgi:hypothetical protein